jgi:hypothetical protein
MRNTKSVDKFLENLFEKIFILCVAKYFLKK